MEHQEKSTPTKRSCCCGSNESQETKISGEGANVLRTGNGNEAASTRNATEGTSGTAAGPAGAAELRDAVRAGYARVVAGPGSSCCTGGAASDPAAETFGVTAATNPCCGTKNVDSFAQQLGYTAAELAALPEGANLGLSCGNPTAIASLRPGETVLDLGSGAGFDAFIAARKVGPQGRVIGVDMTPEMLARARRNTATAGTRNVEFRLGEIESLPVADASVDVVISNCVINLSPDKPQVFREVARVLRPGGRLAVSDMALLRPLPADVREDIQAYIGCIAGAVLVDEYVAHIRDAGLVDIEVVQVPNVDAMEDVQDPLYRRIVENLPAGTRPEDFIASVRVQARKAGA